MRKPKQTRQINPNVSAAIDESVEAALSSKLRLIENQIAERVVQRLKQQSQDSIVPQRLPVEPNRQIYNPLAGP